MLRIHQTSWAMGLLTWLNYGTKGQYPMKPNLSLCATPYENLMNAKKLEHAKTL